MVKSSFFKHGILCIIAIWISLLGQTSQAAGSLLSVEERAWLNAHPNLSLTMWDDYPPISFNADNGLLQGFMPDYIKLLESKLNYKFKHVVPSKQDALSKGQIAREDVISLLANTQDRRSIWNFGPTLLSFPLNIVARTDAPKDLTLSQLNNLKLSVVNGYASHEFLQENYPQVNLDLVNNTCQGLQHVAFHESFAMLTDLPVASWCLQTQGLINIKVAGKSEFKYEMSLAVRKDMPMLFSIIQKGMKSITKSERQTIHDRWLEQNAFEQSWISLNRVWIITLVLFLMLFALIRVFVWDSKMQSNVHQKITKFSAEEGDTLEHISKVSRGLSPRILTLLCFILIILGTLITSEQWVSHQDRILLGILVATLMLIMLFGGYKLGSIRRNEENHSLFEQLDGQIRTRQVAEKIAKEQTLRLFKQQKAIQILSQTQTQEQKTTNEIFKEITQVSAETLNVERVSIWLFDSSHQMLECADLFLKTNNIHITESPLLAHELPVYFEFISQNRVLAVADVMQHPSTVEFREDYVQENSIGAILDGSIWLNGNMIGAVCCEHTHGPREWTLDEQGFVGSVCDAVRLAIESDRRHNAEQALLQHSEELEVMVEARTLSLQESEQRLTSVIKYAPIPILTIKMNGEIIEFNPEAESVTGFSRDEAIGKNFIDIFVVKESFKKTIAIGMGAKRGEAFRNVELIFKCADGRKIEFECSIVKAGKIGGRDAGKMIAIGQDITQKKVLQASLIKARESAESADRIKSMFVASMSHELRTPLNSIIGFLGVVLQGMSGDLNIKQKDQLGRAYHSAKHLLSLISDVIDISKIEAGFLETHSESFALKPMFNEVENVIHHIAEGKHLNLHIDCSEDISLETDRKRLYQAILNVVSNAVKYTEAGTVIVKASIFNEDLIITTQDTGIGISQSGIEQLFKPFERAESHLKIKTLGTGLGLYLTRKILTQLLGGSIEVESQVGVGSTFTIKVPIKLSEHALINNQSILENSNL
ncbi:MAG: transporter substrate-binding domain-containing protein [Methylotenera sp.]|uniref:ATP-binding protein n=1 Tax=Methylotenera sp. TaxID=2051956 RepID=UPI002488E7DC|nr:transporter substrate-binding domain-containing protein [Methylotenera sp.]MDI1310257.1 transporter substrate-binding domain-containing protein [Methylotenera sp.]